MGASFDALDDPASLDELLDELLDEPLEPPPKSSPPPARA
jgi:hypothetical protein